MRSGCRTYGGLSLSGLQNMKSMGFSRAYPLMRKASQTSTLHVWLVSRDVITGGMSHLRHEIFTWSKDRVVRMVSGNIQSGYRSIPKAGHYRRFQCHYRISTEGVAPVVHFARRISCQLQQKMTAGLHIVSCGHVCFQ